MRQISNVSHVIILVKHVMVQVIINVMNAKMAITMKMVNVLLFVLKVSMKVIPSSNV